MGAQALFTTVYRPLFGQLRLPGGWGGRQRQAVVEQANLLLRIRDLNSLFLVCLPNCHVEIGFQLSLAVLWIGDPKKQIQIDAAVGKLIDLRCRGRFLKYPRMVERGVGENAQGVFQRTMLGDLQA
jgi:hypothetical protein